jgi:hypothetical protein
MTGARPILGVDRRRDWRNSALTNDPAPHTNPPASKKGLREECEAEPPRMKDSPRRYGNAPASL